MPMPVAGRLGRSSPFWVDFDVFDGLDRNGLPIFRSGQVPTYARGGTVNTATLVDRRGRTILTGPSMPRLAAGYDAAVAAFVGRGLRLEPQRKNLALSPNDFSATWSAIGTPTRVAAACRVGEVVLDLIGDDDAAALEGYSQPISFTGDGVKAVRVTMRQGSSASTVIRVRDTTAPADRLLAAVTWNAGLPVVTMTTGVNLLGTPERQWDDQGNVVWVAFLQCTSVTAANAHTLYAYPATTAALAVGSTGTVYLGGWQVEDAPHPSSFIPQSGSALTRSPDSLTVAFNPTLQEFTVRLTAALASDLGAGISRNLLNIGNTTNGAEIYVTGLTAKAEIRGTPNVPSAGAVVSPGALTTMVAQFANWGTAPVCRLDVGSGFGAWSSASDARAALGAALLTLNGGSNGAAVADYQRLIVAPGSWTRDQLSAY